MTLIKDCLLLLICHLVVEQNSSATGYHSKCLLSICCASCVESIDSFDIAFTVPTVCNLLGIYAVLHNACCWCCRILVFSNCLLTILLTLAFRPKFMCSDMMFCFVMCSVLCVYYVYHRVYIL